MKSLAQIAADAARDALVGWSADDPDAAGRLSGAIGLAVAAAIQRHETSSALHTAHALAGVGDDQDDDDSSQDWQV
jgi:hypothetical protein